MRIPLILIFIVAVCCPAVDIGISRIINRLRHDSLPYRIARTAHLAVVFIAYALLITGYCLPRTGGSDSILSAKMWLLFTFASIYIPKVLFIFFDLIASLPLLTGRRRRHPVTVAGAVIAFLLFAGEWYGALVNRFRIDTREVDITMPSLPASFDGYRVIQISDLHTGTFGNDTAFVSRLVDHINSLDADMVVFTGDIVNRNSYELDPHAAPLSRLRARDGVFAILGNHDYGDYYSWPSAEAKQANMDHLYGLFDRMGWHLLRNSTAFIHRDADSLAVIGVENIGDPPFPVYGSLDKAYQAGADGTAKILLSHNPAHWVNDIARGTKPNDIDLTLAGHTHAMQIELLGISPAAFRYPTWGGLYDDGQGRNLYVNIGAGTVGLPMRIGATPEVTVLSLHSRP